MFGIKDYIYKVKNSSNLNKKNRIKLCLQTLVLGVLLFIVLVIIALFSAGGSLPWGKGAAGGQVSPAKVTENQ
jgi:hypothetical protein